MKRFFALCMAFAMVINTANAAFTESTTSAGTIEKKEKLGSFKSAEMKMAAEMFVKMTRKDYEQLTGKRMSLVERAAFKIQQKRMKKELQRADGDGSSTVIGLLAGLILSLVGVLLVYLLSDDSNMRTWAWIGAAISFIIFGALII